MKVSLDPETHRGRAGTRNLEAYELMLRGRALHSRRGRHLLGAIRCFEQAIAIDPTYAEALGLLADSYRLMATFGAAPFAGVTAKARQVAEQAIAIDPDLAEPWSTLACVAEQCDWDFAQANVYWDKALILDPRHSRARAQRAVWAAMRWAMPDDQAIAEVRRSVDDDPLNSWVVAMYSYMLGIAGTADLSLSEAHRACSLDPESFFPQWNLIRAHALNGDHAGALALAPSTLAESGRHHWILGLVAWIHGEADDRSAARAVYDEMDGRSRHEFMPPFWLASAAAAAGLDEQAVSYARRCVAEHDPLTLWSRRMPFWNRVRQNPGIDESMRPVWGG